MSRAQRRHNHIGISRVIAGLPHALSGGTQVADPALPLLDLRHAESKADMIMPLAEKPDIFDLLNGSYARLLKAEPLAMGHDADWLYHKAPFAVLAHNKDADPLFIYANRAAQLLFEYTWDEFIGLPSRLSAAPADRADRARLFADVARDGFSTAYSGTRVAKSGRSFRIDQAVIWQLRDEQGQLHGEAAKIGSWRDISRPAIK